MSNLECTCSPRGEFFRECELHPWEFNRRSHEMTIDDNYDEIIELQDKLSEQDLTIKTLTSKNHELENRLEKAESPCGFSADPLTPGTNGLPLYSPTTLSPYCSWYWDRSLDVT